MADPELRKPEDLPFHELAREGRFSSVQKYQAMTVGRPGVWPLVKYELLTGTVGLVPGALGILLRQYLYRFLLRQMGRGVVIGRSVTVRHPSKISIGSGSVIDDYALLNALGGDDSEIVIGDRALVGRGSVIKTRGGRIVLEDGADLSHNVRLTTGELIRIGKHVLLGPNCCIGGTDHRIDDTETPIAFQGLRYKGGVVIEDDVWLGINVTVLDGVRIGAGSVVAAGAVVTRDLPPGSLARGIPARITGTRE
ncbi:MAG: hypothetical protein QOD06_1137 [Candidatus Binatota bacterium]|nr:hypothetical protein [Candidatus Binatota bacterium]